MTILPLININPDVFSGNFHNATFNKNTTVVSQYYISDKGQKYRKDVQQIIRQLKLDIFTKSRLRIKVIADVPDSRRRDLDNILKGLLDSLIHAGFAEDDEQFDDIRVIRGVKVPGGRLGIKITELENV